MIYFCLQSILRIALFYFLSYHKIIIRGEMFNLMYKKTDWIWDFLDNWGLKRVLVVHFLYFSPPYTTLNCRHIGFEVWENCDSFTSESYIYGGSASSPSSHTFLYVLLVIWTLHLILWCLLYSWFSLYFTLL